MKKSIKYYLIALIILPFTILSKTPSDSLKIDEIKQHINILEGQKENLENSIKIKGDALDNKFDEFKNGMKNDYNYLQLIVWIFGSVTVVGLLVGWFTIYKYVLKTAKKAIDNKFDSFFSNQKGKLIELIHHHGKEVELRESVKINVVSSNSSDETFINNFFKETEFKNVNYVRSDIYEPIQHNPDLIFFNNSNGSLSNIIINEYITKSASGTLFFHFGSMRLDDTGPGADKIGIANKKVQIYGNLMNILKYQDLIK